MLSCACWIALASVLFSQASDVVVQGAALDRLLKGEAADLVGRDVTFVLGTKAFRKAEKVVKGRAYFRVQATMLVIADDAEDLARTRAADGLVRVRGRVLALKGGDQDKGPRCAIEIRELRPKRK